MANHPQMDFAFGNELIVDLFAGGGGASLGIEQAFGRCVDIAVNHDPDAIAMHAANHPTTKHLRNDVFEVNPLQVTRGRQVGLLWASPDCKHFSKAKGGKPRSKKIRSLAWVVVKWATIVRPRVIMLENVEEFVTWGPLAENGQPCPQRKGRTFRRWVANLRSLGYKVEWKELRACDYGAPTIRKRFFLIARCDGLPIRWPKPTHGKPDSAEVRSGKLLPWRTAAECIDWTKPCPSIFLTKEEGRAIGVRRPLAEATMRRIAKGVERYVLNATAPYIVRIGQTGGNGAYSNAIETPLTTITTKAEHCLALPTLIQTGYGEREGQAPRAPGLDKPLGTAVAGGVKHALVAAFLSKQYGGNESPGWPLQKPVSTITAQDHHFLAASSLVKLRGDNIGTPLESPIHTISAQGLHHAEVRAFLVKFYSTGGQHSACDEPMHTVPSRDRMGLVTVDGTDYAIADIGLRMLAPRELFRAQGFPDTYVIDRGADGRRLPKDAQVRMCGNSVCPPMARALVEANVGEIRHVVAREVVNG